MKKTPRNPNDTIDLETLMGFAVVRMSDHVSLFCFKTRSEIRIPYSLLPLAIHALGQLPILNSPKAVTVDLKVRTKKMRDCGLHHGDVKRLAQTKALERGLPHAR